MKTKIFTVYDVKAQANMTPFFMQSTGQAVRAFEDTVNDPKSAFNKHPEDYTLFEIGTFDDQTGTLENHKASISLGTALSMITPNTPPLEAVQ